MRRIIFTFSFLIISFYLVGCAGYKPIFASAKVEFDIGMHKIEGDKLLGNKIFSNVKNLSKKPKHMYMFSHVVRKFLTDIIKHKLN